jgi:hypothetical protein
LSLFGAFGSLPVIPHDTPAPADATALFTDVSLGVNGSYALDAQGTAYAWGSPGCCDLPGPATPTPLPGRITLETLAATDFGACGLTAAEHIVICWAPEPDGLHMHPAAPPASVSPAPPATSTLAAPERSPPAFPSRSRR